MLTSPRILEHPARPTISEVRREAAEGGTVCIKFVETRVITTLLGEEERANNRFVRIYERERVRAVNVARLTVGGAVEVRIYAHRGHPSNYLTDVSHLLNRLNGLLDPTKLTPLPLARAKQALWDKRKALAGRIRFSDSVLRSDQGTAMAANTGNPQDTLWDDPSADAGLSVFMKEGEAICERHNLWWLANTSGLPSRDIHVVLDGAVNEFAIMQRCSRKDYEYVLVDIQKFNR